MDWFGTSSSGTRASSPADTSGVLGRWGSWFRPRWSGWVRRKCSCRWGRSRWARSSCRPNRERRRTSEKQTWPDNWISRQEAHLLNMWRGIEGLEKCERGKSFHYFSRNLFYKMNEAISDQRLEQSQRPVVPCTLRIPFLQRRRKITEKLLKQ